MAPHNNPLVTTQRTSDNVPAVLHPLVLLSISDNITRHTLRGNKGPVTGALLGQQNGRQVTIEYTFDFNVALEKSEKGETKPTFDDEWFEDRLQQMRLVHADRHLDLVGWYTVLGRDGPTPNIQHIHKKVQRNCRESTAAVLLAFHPEDLEEQTVGGRLPVTLFETHYEQEDELSTQKTKQEGPSLPTQSSPPKPESKEKQPEELGGDDKEMTDAASSSVSSSTADDGTESQLKTTSDYVFKASDGLLPFKFREITYTVETEEAERISIDFVARGVANASSAAATGDDRKLAGKDVAGKGSSSSTSPRDRAVAIESGNRSKRRLVAADDSTPAEETGTGSSKAGTAAAAAATDVVLSREDEELISTLTTRANAIRMLHARLQLLTRYLEALPPNAVEEGGRVATADDRGGNDASNDGSSDSLNSGPVGVSLPILRSIQALVQRLPLVIPPPVDGAFEEEQRREANDVQLASLLLDDVMQSIGRVRQTGGKLAVFLDGASARNNPGGGPGGAVSAAARAALYRANSGGPANAGRPSAAASRTPAYHTVS